MRPPTRVPQFKTLRLSAGLMTLVAAATAQVAAGPPEPPRNASAPGKPVAVFILLGQSNMVGFGRIALPGKKGTLEVLCKEDGKSTSSTPRASGPSGTTCGASRPPSGRHRAG